MDASGHIVLPTNPPFLHLGIPILWVSLCGREFWSRESEPEPSKKITCEKCRDAFDKQRAIEKRFDTAEAEGVQ